MHWLGDVYVMYNMVSKGFDEFMNLVLDSAEEVYRKKQTRRAIG